MTKDATPLIVGVAALAVALTFINENHDLKQRITTCQVKFHGFKQGVLHAK